VKILLAIVSLSVFLAAVVVTLYFFALTPASISTKASVNFLINRGESAASILSRLESQKLIRSSIVTRVYLKINNLEKKLVPGEFSLSGNNSTQEIIKGLMVGPKDIWVTFPEGWRREQIGARLLGINPNFNLDNFIKDTATIEGQLFPDSYLVPKDITSDQAIRMLTMNFSNKAKLNPQNAQDRNLLTIASLIEREGQNTHDRSLISSVIENRLNIGMALQVDASVQYATDSYNCQKNIVGCEWWKPVLDTKFPSLFNTYINPGLPPHPICNPGLSSIESAKNPNKSDFLYYITGNDGVTRFAKNLQEHQLNIDKYLKP